MDGSVKAQSEAIAEFELALGRFAQRSLERAADASVSIARAVKTLEDRRRQLRREMKQLQDEIASAGEEEDTSHAKRRLEEVEDEMGTVRRWQLRVDDQFESYRREAIKLNELSTGITVKTRTYLRQQLRDLSAYFALQMDHNVNELGAPKSMAGMSHNVPTSSNEVFDPTSLPIPSGFQWVALSDIDTVRELADVRSKSSFRKTSFDAMRTGFEMLRTYILPAMNDPDRPADKDTFRARDLDKGASYENGALRVYDAFFGMDAIYLERGSRNLFSIVNGRHRVMVAMDLGWKAVPARTDERSG